MKKCKCCGNECEDDVKFCNECGYKFEENEAVVEETKDNTILEEINNSYEEAKPRIVECPTCGAAVNVDEYSNCPVCGALLKSSATVKAEANKDKKATKKNGFANASFIIGIVATVLWMTFAEIGGVASIFFVLVELLGIVFGIVGLATKAKGKSMVFAIIGLALCAEAFLLTIIYPSVIKPIMDGINEEIEEFYYNLFIKLFK